MSGKSGIIKSNNPHVLHGDYTVDNVFFSNSSVSAVFDFEKAVVGPRAFEIWRCIFYSLFEREKNKTVTFCADQKAYDDARTFLGTYKNVYPIDNDELVTGFKLLREKEICSVWIEEEYLLHDNVRPMQYFASHVARTSFCESFSVSEVIG